MFYRRQGLFRKCRNRLAWPRCTATGDDFYRMDRISADSEDKEDTDPRDTRGHTSDDRSREVCHRIRYIASLELHNHTPSCCVYIGKAANSSCYTGDSCLEGKRNGLWDAKNGLKSIRNQSYTRNLVFKKLVQNSWTARYVI